MEFVGQEVVSVVVLRPGGDLREGGEILVAQLDESASAGEHVPLECQGFGNVRFGRAVPCHARRCRGTPFASDRLDVLGAVGTLLWNSEQGGCRLFERVRLAVADRRACRVETDVLVVFPEASEDAPDQHVDVVTDVSRIEMRFIEDHSLQLAALEDLDVGMAQHHVFHHRIVGDEDVRRFLADLLATLHEVGDLMPAPILFPFREIRIAADIGRLPRVHADRDAVRVALDIEQFDDALELILDERIHWVNEQDAHTRLLERLCGLGEEQVVENRI